MTKYSEKEIHYEDVLLDLLEEYLDIADMWEEHHKRCIDKGFKTLDEEKDAHRYIQSKFSIPFMSKVTDLGFAYVDILEIIPPAFETNSYQREAILHDLFCFVSEKRDRHDPPF